jgi:Pup amidohydrolase
LSIPKTVGVETEYGILAKTNREVDPFVASRMLMSHFRKLGLIAVPHNETYISPQEREESVHSDPSITQVPVERDTFIKSDGEGHYDWMIANGARIYIDHAHPEYSTPECLSARSLVAADKAGEVIMERCCQAVIESRLLPEHQAISIYKNNSDHKGNSYGCHENYLLGKDFYSDLLYRKPELVAAHLLPFFITRTILCGAGKVGSENGAPSIGFQLSQRADFFETLVGVQTTFRRPLFNIRDEPHANPSQYRRLHVIIGDANMAELSTYLKIGTTQLVLRMLEDGFLTTDLTLAEPLVDMLTVSRDLSFRRKLTLCTGKELSALEIQREYLSLVRTYLRKAGASEEERDIIKRWTQVLDTLEADWRQLAASLDWAIKKNLLDHYVVSKNTTWEEVGAWQSIIENILRSETEMANDGRFDSEEELKNPDSQWQARVREYLQRLGLREEIYLLQREVYFGLRRMDLEYHDICREDSSESNIGLFYRLQNRNVIERIVTDEEINRMIEEPPKGSRAWFRGNSLKRFSDAIEWADWSCISFLKTAPANSSSCVLRIENPLSDYTAETASVWGQLAKIYDPIKGEEQLTKETPKEHQHERTKKSSQAKGEAKENNGSVRRPVAKKVASQKTKKSKRVGPRGKRSGRGA